jgi:hypothetical protein
MANKRFEREYHTASSDQIWLFANRPRHDRVSLRMYLQCFRPKCPNLLMPVWLDDEKTQDETHQKFWHQDDCVVVENLFMGYSGIREPVYREVRQHVLKRVFRERLRLLCRGCRQALYCSKACGKLDAGRHKGMCKNNPPNILQAVILEDTRGVKMLLEKDPTLALKKFGKAQHSIYEFAKATGFKPVIQAIENVMPADALSVREITDMLKEVAFEQPRSCSATAEEQDRESKEEEAKARVFCSPEKAKLSFFLKSMAMSKPREKILNEQWYLFPPDNPPPEIPAQTQAP